MPFIILPSVTLVVPLLCLSRVFAARLGVPFSAMAGSTSRDVLPLPLPFPCASLLASAQCHSRGTRRRLRANGLWQQWANSGISALNDLAGYSTVSCVASKLQHSVSADLVSHYRMMDKPPVDLLPSGALSELCRHKMHYFDNEVGPVPYKRESVALPTSLGALIIPEESMSERHVERLVAEF